MKCNYCPKNLRGRNFTTNGAFCSLCGDSVFSLEFPANCSEISYDKIKKGDLVFNIPEITSKFDLDFFIPLSVLKKNSTENINISCNEIAEKNLIDVSKCSFYLELPGFSKISASNIKFGKTPSNNFPLLAVNFKDFFSLIKKKSINSSYFKGKFIFFFSQKVIEKDVHFFIYSSWPPVYAKPWLNKSELVFWFRDDKKNIVTLLLQLTTNKQHWVYLKQIGSNYEFCDVILKISDKQIKGIIKTPFPLSKNKILDQNKIFPAIIEFDISGVKNEDLVKEQNIACLFYLEVFGFMQKFNILERPSKTVFKGPISLKIEPNDAEKYQVFHREIKTCNFEIKIKTEEVKTNASKQILFILKNLYLALPQEVEKNDYKLSISNCFDISANNEKIYLNKWCYEKFLSVTLITKNLPSTCIGKDYSVVAKFQTEDSKIHFIQMFQVHIKGYDQFSSDLSIDFGTSNSCVVIRTGVGNRSQPKILNLRTIISGEIYTSEKFNGVIPTIIFFEDISDPVNPKYKIGHEAHFASTSGKNIIKFFKRDFVNNTEYLITDSNGRKCSFSAEKLAVFFITRMLEMVEHFSQKYIASFSASFPTKWPQQASARLCKVLEQVSDRLFEINGGLNRPKIISPKLDEASACILSTIKQMVFDNEFKDNKCILLGSIDIGGGTTDTTLVKVKYTPGEEEEFQFDFIGFGGFADFGGTDISFRMASFIAKLINDNIINFIDPSISSARYVFPVNWIYDNQYKSSYGTKPSGITEASWDEQKEFNSNILFDLAEKLKINSSEELRNYAILGSIEDLKVLKIFDKDFNFISLLKINDNTEKNKSLLLKVLNVSMKDIFDLKFNNFINLSMPTYSIKDIVESISQEMMYQISLYNGFNSHLIQNSAVSKINKLIIAGGASSDKYINDTITKALDITSFNDRISDKQNPKFYVSYGLSWYLEQLKNNIFESLSFSVGLLHNSVVKNNNELNGQPNIIFHAGLPNKNLKSIFKITKNMIRSREKIFKRIIVSSICWSIETEYPIEIGVFEIQNYDFQEVVDKISNGADLNALILFENGIFSLSIDGEPEKIVPMVFSENHKEAFKKLNINL